MNHGKKGRKFGRNTASRKALLVGLVKSLVKHESISTTLPKAKDIRPITEKLITKGRDNSLHIKRQLLSWFSGDAEVVNKIINNLSPRYKERPGGYIRILKNGFRNGDCAPMAIIQFV